MAVQHANRGIVKKDLQLYYNREFSKSFRGEATTNLYGAYNSKPANAYPASGNDWGTYYARSPYASGNFVSIGTIASVSSNIITVSSPTSYFNGLATFDVIRPQTTGGGLTANVDYYFKRLSSTTFTLHQYDGTNDASKTPEQILTYVNSDTRISVNATSFPTMWWGYPHLPNSALIKTAVKDGFAYDNRFHDCLRLNWFRTDATDGMAYGVYPTYIANTQYTFSCYVRASSQNAIGGQIYFTLYFSGTATSIGGFYSPTLTANWQKWTQTFTTSATGGTLYTYIWSALGTLPGTVDIAELQVEQKTYASEFTINTRSANTVAGGGGLLDLSGNNYNSNLTTVSSFDSSGYYFNGSSDYIDLGSDITFKSSGGWSVSSWFNLTQVVSGNLYNFIGASAITYNSWYWTVYQSKLALWNISPGGWYYGSTTIQANTWYNAVLVCSYDGTQYQMYLNGVAESGTHVTYAWNASYSGLKIGYVGRGDASNGRYFYGKYPNFQVYNRALTADEVLQNFNATRKTYGI